MTLQFKVDNQQLAELDEALVLLHEDREAVVLEAFAELVRKKKREAEIAKQYAEAYAKQPLRSEEWEIDDEQTAAVWDMMEAEENESR